MNVELNLNHRLRLIDVIGNFQSTTDLIKDSDSFINTLTPTREELSVEGLNFNVTPHGVHWDRDVESDRIGLLKVTVPPSMLDILVTHYSDTDIRLNDIDSEILSLIEGRV